MNPEYKQCSKCHQLKLVTEFVRKKQCKSCISAYHAAYRAANRERRSAYDAANRWRRSEYLSAYRAAHRDQSARSSAKYREKNPERIKAYRAANRERRSAYDAANRERIKAYRDSYRAGKTKNHRTTHFFQTLLLASKQQQNKTP